MELQVEARFLTRAGKDIHCLPLDINYCGRGLHKAGDSGGLGPYIRIGFERLAGVTWRWTRDHSSWPLCQVL